ncbi:MAG TPA: pantetheine-phosphate adenylyltransferase [Chthonomonadaceae bacterium]|nr:pantetheine-phosphate adenylyltransferase [Chthonomonadaceae bacterium]
MATAIVPGSFDPVTNGHVDIIQRAAVIFERVIVVVARNASKTPLFTLDERLEMLQAVCAPYPNVEVDTFEGLLVAYAVERGATVIVKGLRAVSDFEYELQMASMNRRLANGVETMFLMTGAEYSYLSSNIVKEIARLGGAVEGLVPHDVEKRLRQKYASQPKP